MGGEAFTNMLLERQHQLAFLLDVLHLVDVRQHGLVGREALQEVVEVQLHERILDALAPRLDSTLATPLVRHLQKAHLYVARVNATVLHLQDAAHHVGELQPAPSKPSPCLLPNPKRFVGSQAPRAGGIWW